MGFLMVYCAMTQIGSVNTRLDKHSNKQWWYDPAFGTSTLGLRNEGRKNGAIRRAEGPGY
jgi:hypothetical protein